MSCILMVVLGMQAVAAKGAAERTTEARIDAVFAAQDSTRTPGCAVGVMRKGEIIFQRGYGMADLEHGTPVTADSVFSIASVSKQFTAAAIALLEEQGRLSADDDVRKYVPELRDYGHVVRVHHLIHHSSGLRDVTNLWWLSGRNRGDSLAQEEALALLARQRQLNFTPGEQYSYSNSGYLLLAVIVERVSGMPLAEFAERHIFRPLGMVDTRYHHGDSTPAPSGYDTVPIIPNLAVPYLKIGSGNEYRRVRTSHDSIGASGVITTLQDLARWEANFYDNRLGKGGPALIERLLSRRALASGRQGSYAYGLTIVQYRGLPTVLHSGGSGGYSAFLQRFPDQRISVAVLCNEGRLSVGRLTREVVSVYLQDQFLFAEQVPQADPLIAETTARLQKASPPTAQRLSDYAGDYYSDELETRFRVRAPNGKLTITARYAPAREPRSIGPDQFIYDGVNQVTFKRDRRGRVTGMQFSAERIRSLDVPKL